jgi:hypothetical protein
MQRWCRSLIIERGPGASSGASTAEGNGQWVAESRAGGDPRRPGLGRPRERLTAGARPLSSA